MTTTTAPVWESKRTQETRQIEELLKNAGFQRADAYRFNSASIRVRVIDSRFEGLSHEKRDAMIEPLLERLPEETQEDIMSLFTFAPSEVEQTPKLSKQFLLNAEFDDPSPSML